jgi:uncharacterized membrane protein (GlpM family)
MQSIGLNLFISGILFGSGPCIASCGPVLLSYLVSSAKTPRSSLIAYAVFSSARLLTYVALAAGAFLAGTFALEHGLQRWHGRILFAGGTFVILLGVLACAESRRGGFITRCRCVLVEKGGKSTFLLGVVAGVSPCAPLLGVLSYIVFVAKSAMEAVLYGAAFGLGTCMSPLVLLAAAAGFLGRIPFTGTEAYVRIFRYICAAVLIALGVQLLIRGIQS